MRGRAAPPPQGYIEYPPPMTKRLESERANVKFFYNSVKLTTIGA